MWFYIDLAVFALVGVLTGIIIPQILLIAFRKNLFDAPDPRKIHKGTVPRLGGIAFFPAIIFSLFLLFGVGMLMHQAGVLAELSSMVMPLSFIICALVVIYLVGMADDLVGVKYRAKFVAQIICALLICSGGIILDDFHGFLSLHILPDWVAILLTVILTVFITNAINLIDGIDGLASGLSAIACLFYAWVFYGVGLYLYSVLAVATLGALVPFFLYNVWGNVTKHRKIFMGDTGALTIGLILSVLSIRICHLPALAHGGNPAAVAFAPLLIPCLDVVRVYLHRLKSGRNPFLPDKTHIHHKLLALGMRQRVAMPCIIGASALLTLANYILSGTIDITLLFALDLLLWIVVNMILTRLIHRRERLTGQKLFE